MILLTSESEWGAAAVATLITAILTGIGILIVRIRKQSNDAYINVSNQNMKERLALANEWESQLKSMKSELEDLQRNQKNLWAAYRKVIDEHVECEKTNARNKMAIEMINARIKEISGQQISDLGKHLQDLSSQIAKLVNKPIETP